MTSAWKHLCQRPTDSITKAIETLDRASGHICLVIDGNERLLGTVTDGDIRRGLLRAIPLDAPVSEVMKKDPVVGRPGQSPAELRRLMEKRFVRQIPVVDASGRVIGLHLLDDLIAPETREPKDNLVVLMAGGLGERLRPLTEDMPKPLLKVGSKPILERILESFIEHDFRNFAISVNYKSEMIKEHFDDGSKWGVSIRYLTEEDRLGTAGALSLIDTRPHLPLIVMNGDVLTKVNIENMLTFHAEQKAKAMMCVRSYELQIPYGVVRTQNMRITALDEKPHHQFLVNAGIYVLEPETLDCIPRGVPFDMPDLFRALIRQGQDTAVFPIREYWMDIGRMDDYEQANTDISRLFNPDAAS